MTSRNKAGHAPDDAGMETDIWSSYWRGPRLVCSLAGAGIGYPEALVEVWRKFFAEFPDGTRLLDIATGNGAVAIIASDTARALGRRFDVHGSDQADIDPAMHLRGTGFATEGIRFHPRTPAEHTGFPAGHFDVITGQFALEYTGMPASVAEAARILKPGGTARFILHMKGSEIYTQTERQLQDIHLAMTELGILRKARAMFAAAWAFDSAGGSDEQRLLEARRAQEAYLQAARILDERVPTAAYKELFVSILKVVAYQWEHRREQDPQEFAVRLDEMEREIALAEKRHAAMCEHALDAVQVEQLQGLLEASGFLRPSLATLKITMKGVEGSVGWDLLARRG